MLMLLIYARLHWVYHNMVSIYIGRYHQINAQVGDTIMKLKNTQYKFLPFWFLMFSQRITQHA